MGDLYHFRDSIDSLERLVKNSGSAIKWMLLGGTSHSSLPVWPGLALRLLWIRGWVQTHNSVLASFLLVTLSLRGQE